MNDPQKYQLARVPMQPLSSPPNSPSMGGAMGAMGGAMVQTMPDVPSSAVFNQIQRTALEVLTETDYHSIGGKRFIKKSGWRVRTCQMRCCCESP